MKDFKREERTVIFANLGIRYDLKCLAAKKNITMVQLLREMIEAETKRLEKKTGEVEND